MVENLEQTEPKSSPLRSHVDHQSQAKVGWEQDERLGYLAVTVQHLCLGSITSKHYFQAFGLGLRSKEGEQEDELRCNTHHCSG